MKNRLFYTEPAQDWNHALPLGNGRLGAMVYSGVTNDILQLNEESIWAGPPVPENRVGSHKYIEEATNLIFEGNYLDAQKLLQDNVMSDIISPRSYQPLGEVLINLNNQGDYTNYKRELDLSTALLTTTWSSNGINFTREYFISVEKQLIICKTYSNIAHSLSGEISFRRDGDVIISSEKNKIIINGQAEHDGKNRGVKFSSIIYLESNSGEISAKNNNLYIKDASEFTIYIPCQTDYNIGAPYSPKTDNLLELCNNRLSQITNYEQIKSQNIIDHQALYNRFDLQLGDERDSNTPTDKLLENFKEKPSLKLINLYFNYARYLIISCSRPGNLCANLQGIWSKDMSGPWDCDYHININIQMIYWLVESIGLPECHLPFIDFSESLIANGKITAKEVYECRGSVSHYTSDVWGYTAPCGDVEYGMWPLGSAWNSRHFMDHYEYTGDKKFLKDRALPFLKEISIFLYDYLVVDPITKKLLFGPASSPENKFYDPTTGEICNISLGCSMGQQIVWESFTNYLRCLDILEISDEYQEIIKNALAILKETNIGSDGRLLEWMLEFKEVEEGHRHVSHLYGIFPGFQYSSNKEYLNAAEKTLKHRLSNGGGHTGWSKAWIINLWAKLGEKQLSLDNLYGLFTDSTLPNLFDNHPPFQLDGNMGGAAGILEMLIQSNNGVIELFKSAPKEFNSGSIKGLCLRGGFVMDLVWDKFKILRLNVKSKNGNKLIITDREGKVISKIQTETNTTYNIV